MTLKRVDYIIVGQGIAGSCFAMKLLQENKSFIVIDDDKHNASSVAAGLYNPVVLKRFSIVWNAVKQLAKLHEVFSQFERLLGEKYIVEFPVYRVFFDDAEKKAWLKKAVNNPELTSFLTTDTDDLSSYNNIKNPFGSGKLKQTGRVKLTQLLADFRHYLSERKLLIEESFDYASIDLTSTTEVSYQNITAKNIVFCEGYNVLENPYFGVLPIIGNKGEVMHIHTRATLPNAIIKGREFLLPLGEENYFVGATYEREKVDYIPTENGKQELSSGLQQFFDEDFEVKQHLASIRPTVIDRRPIIGRHPLYSRLAVMNGMGTRGTMLAPLMAEELYLHLEEGKEIDKEADINRFKHLFD